MRYTRPWRIVMRALIIVALVAGTIGFGAGMAFWYLASPLWINVEVSERLSAESQAATLVTGEFRDRDAIHQGSGTATIFRGEAGELTLRLTNFSVTNGPDLKIWLVAAEHVEGDEAVKSSDYLALGPLKGNIGDQNYEIPAGTDISAYPSVVVWCEQFGVLFSAADLMPPV
jgi:hypothetical protein